MIKTEQLSLFGLPASASPRRKRKLMRLQQRNARIVNRFNTLYKQGLRLDAICEKLEPEFGLAPETIRKIVAGQR